MASAHVTDSAGEESRTSWTPLLAIFFAQVLMSINVTALPISLSGMIESFDATPTEVSTGIVTYGLVVAALVMTGAKLGQKFGWVVVFRVVIVVFAAAMVLMFLAPAVWVMITAQALAGASAAIIVPALVALIAENYRGEQQATAVGSLGSARAGSGVTAFLLGGILGTYAGWRPVWMILTALAVVVFALSFKLRSDTADRSVVIDVVGALLIGVSVVSLTLGFNNLNDWGAFLASDDAPFSVLSVSPALLLLLVGVLLGQLFFAWTRHRVRLGRTPLISLDVVGSKSERSAVYALFVVVALEAALNFTVPLYIQVVQGNTPLATSVAMIPFNLTVFVAAMVVVRFYKRFSPRTIALTSFLLTTAALVWLAFVVTNNWETVATIVGLIVFGAGQGALVTLLFNVLVTSSPKHLAGDVGSLRGTTQNLASAVGTALAGAMLVGVLGLVFAANMASSSLPESLRREAGLDNVNFVSNDDLRAALRPTSATPEQTDDAVRINSDARLRALKIGLLAFAAVSALAIVPVRNLPAFDPREIPDPKPRETV
ncbi:MFS transporter [Streptomyces sp. NPDC003717]|uniref:MFS transporter n=1 Tax=Streptomyces sp. NPDC003717 TaxID=3154276 RepID=UPI00339F341E